MLVGGFTLTKELENFDNNNEELDSSLLSGDSEQAVENAPEQDVSDEPTRADNSSENTEKVKPRKRRIVKNNPLPILIIIFAVLLLTTVCWKLFFDNSLTGAWTYINSYELEETIDAPTVDENGEVVESADSAIETVTNTYSQRYIYNFTEDGTFEMTVGTMTMPGMFILSEDDGTKLVSVYVYYSGTPLLYDDYSYELKGNAFTGKKLVLKGSQGDVIELEQGCGENPLEKFDDYTVDESLCGTWRNEEGGLTYSFSDDGTMSFAADDGLMVDFVYDILDQEDLDYEMEGGVILVKYYGEVENTDSYVYSFTEDGNLSLNGTEFEKVEE